MSNTDNARIVIAARSQSERRQSGWRTVVFGFFRSRRQATRRATEPEPLYTDWHHPWLFFLATGTMILSCMDAFFTLQLLDRGAMEINPVMALFIDHSTAAFASTKIAMTGLGILALVYLSRARFMNKFRTGVLLTVCFVLYACLVCYEFVFLLGQL